MGCRSGGENPSSGNLDVSGTQVMRSAVSGAASGVEGGRYRPPQRRNVAASALTDCAVPVCSPRVPMQL